MHSTCVQSIHVHWSQLDFFIQWLIFTTVIRIWECTKSSAYIALLLNCGICQIIRSIHSFCTIEIESLSSNCTECNLYKSGWMCLFLTRTSHKSYLYYCISHSQCLLLFPIMQFSILQISCSISTYEVYSSTKYCSFCLCSSPCW